jgi:hypothetical protein
MNKRIYRVIDKELFEEYSIKQYPLIVKDGISILRGMAKDGKEKLHAFVFENDWPENKIKEWIEANKSRFGEIAVLPDDATSLWLDAYDEACLSGKSSSEAEQIAWAELTKHWHKDESGKWAKLEDDWQKAVTKLGAPIEIFRAGCYPQLESEENPEGRFTIGDIDTVVDNFNNGYVSPAAITVDHVNSGAALGWITKLFRSGEKLFGIPENINPRLIEKLKNKEYLHRSIEMWNNYFNEQTQKFIGPVFFRLTFLGVKIPAVKGMAVPTFDDGQGKRQNFPLVAFSIDSKEINETMKSIIGKNNKPKPSNPTKGVLMELTEQQLAAQLEAAEAKGRKDAGVLLGEDKSKFEAESRKAQDKIKADRAELDDREKKLADRIKAFEQKEADSKAAADDAKLTSDATTLFTGLADKGQVVTANQPAFINLYKLAARSTEKVKLNSGKEGTMLEQFIEAQNALPNIVKMTELTKKIEGNNQTQTREIKGATDESKEVDAKVVAYCEANKLDVTKSSDYEKAYIAVTRAGK